MVTTTIDKGPVTQSKSLKASVTAIGPIASLKSKTTPPARSHTFAAYTTSATFKPYSPVVIADTEFASEIPYDLTSLADNTALKLAKCAIKNVYSSPRKSGQWTALTGKLSGGLWKKYMHTWLSLAKTHRSRGPTIHIQDLTLQTCFC